MLKGNKLALYQGYTYYKMKKNKKWYCTSYPICDCYVELNSDMVVTNKKVDHFHKTRSLFKTSTGRYTRV